jgi:transposase
MVHLGLKELRNPEQALDAPATKRMRRSGAGRPSKIDDPELRAALDALVEPDTRGDPTSPLRWTSKSLTALAKALKEKGFSISPNSVGTMLKNAGYSLQSTRKRMEGKQHPDRDAQFRYLGEQAQARLGRNQPVISVDTKAKELVGNFKAKGKEWQPGGEPVEVNAYDFPSLGEGKAVPYGVYDVAGNEGWVSVGTNADTSEFAVQSVRTWWDRMGKARYPDAEELLITADCGGSNGYRTRLWKRELQGLADEIGLSITVLHYPPGTSKWNRIEHRMFNHITMNWRGRPLLTFETVVECIANTRTSMGLEINAALDERTYEKGIKVTKEEMEAINISRHAFHGEWNYTIHPTAKLIS